MLSARPVIPSFTSFFLSLLAVLSVLACGTSDRPTSPEPRWLAGDFHVHSSIGSNDTRYPDGSLRSWPETIRDVARDRGLSFVVVTDHSNSTGSAVDTTVEDFRLWNRGPEFPLWDIAPTLSREDFLFINGNELSPVSILDAHICPGCPTLGTPQPEPVGHIGCIPESLDTFVIDGPIIDRPPGAVDGAMTVQQCRDRNGFVILNHPFPRPTQWMVYDWTSFDYDAIEVYNGTIGWDVFDRAAYDAYLCDRLQGRDVVAVGGSDNHRAPLPYEDELGIPLGSPLGLPATSVLAEAVDWEAIMRAVRAGRIVIHELGTFVEFRAVAADGKTLARIGDRVTEGAVTLAVSGRSPRAQTARVFHVAPDGCQDRRTPGRDLTPIVTTTEVDAMEICPEGACEFRYEIATTLEPGLYFATVGDFDTRALLIRDVAMTNVVTVDAR